MKRILVSGAAGYIGGTFTYQALKSGHEVIGVDNFSNSSEKNIKYFKKKFKNNFYFHKSDLSKENNALKKIFENYEIDYVVHFAGLKSVAESEKQPKLYWENNLNSTRNILENLTNRIGLVFSSSATVYGNSKYQPISEKIALRANSTYGSTKIACELMIDDYCRNKNIKAICLRYFNPVGSHSDKVILEPFNNAPNNLMPRIVRVAKGIDPELKVFGKDYNTIDGTAERDYIHISDLISGHFAALNKLNEITDCKYYNLGTGNSTSVLKLLKTFEKVHSLSLNYSFHSRRKGDVEVCFADPALAKKELNWSSKKSLEDMCRDSL